MLAAPPPMLTLRSDSSSQEDDQRQDGWDIRRDITCAESETNQSEVGVVRLYEDPTKATEARERMYAYMDHVLIGNQSAKEK